MLSVYTDKSKHPTEEEVQTTLNENHIFWTAIESLIMDYGTIRVEWKFYSKKTGWCKKIILINGKVERNLIFLYPNQGFFTCVLVFGTKAIMQIEDDIMLSQVSETLKESKQYAEGKSFQYEIHNHQDMALLQKLIEIKINF